LAASGTVTSWTHGRWFSFGFWGVLRCTPQIVTVADFVDMAAQSFGDTHRNSHHCMLSVCVCIYVIRKKIITATPKAATSIIVVSLVV
jgi:hypothetical protein